MKDQLADEGDERKPILFILADDQKEAREVANYLRYGEAAQDDLSGRLVTGFSPREGEAPLFVELDEAGVPRSTVVEIHIGEKEARNEDDWEAVRQKINAIDLDEIPKADSDGRPVKDADGHPVMVPNLARAEVISRVRGVLLGAAITQGAEAPNAAPGRLAVLPERSEHAPSSDRAQDRSRGPGGGSLSRCTSRPRSCGSGRDFQRHAIPVRNRLGPCPGRAGA